MIKVFFNNGEIREAEFEKLSDHVVSVSGESNVSGFITAKLDGSVLGNFSEFQYIYRTLDGVVQYSNDGSVWVDPVPEPPDTEPSAYDVLNQKVDAMYADYDKLDAVAQIVTVRVEQSDKLGYDWKIVSVGNVECSREYIPQKDPKGTSPDNPIIWEDGMTPINNAFYLKPDGKIYVYMDGQWIDWEV